MSDTPKDLSPEDLAGLDRAYDFVQPSYQWALTRFEANNTRLQNLLTAITSVSLAVPALAGALNEALSFDNAWFKLAGIAFLLAVAAGFYGRQAGAVCLADPRELRAWLTLSDAQFKHDALYWAGEHLARSTAAIKRKWRCATFALALFVVEVALLLVWALGA